MMSEHLFSYFVYFHIIWAVNIVTQLDKTQGEINFDAFSLSNILVY